ncbi:MAG: chemotaxis protein CheW [Alicyclobacillus sp.]|nr:chemotaxis protein CheW [Alicyclobacillus sp.]
MEDTGVVVFRVRDRLYGALVEHVYSVEQHLVVTPVPMTPPCILGLTVLRGEVVPVVDVRPRFAAAPTLAGVAHSGDHAGCETVEEPGQQADGCETIGRPFESRGDSDEQDESSVPFTLVVDVRGNWCGFLVDDVVDVCRVHRDEIHPAPRFAGGPDALHLEGWVRRGEELYFVVNLPGFLTEWETSQVESARNRR